MLLKMLALTYFISCILVVANAKNDVHEAKQGEATGCSFDGKKYKHGEQVEGICIDLICENGQWISKGYFDPCCRKCHVRDDPHFWSFDKLHFDFHGTCNYSITQDGTTYNPAFGVFGEFNVCPSGLQWSSCIDIITFKDNPNTVITMTAAAPSDISVNGALPYTVPTFISQATSGGVSHPVLVWMVANCIYLLGTQRLLLQYCWTDWWRELYVFAHPSLTEELYGLCGYYNYYKYDDFTHRNLATSPYTLFYPNAFGESWMTSKQNNKSCVRDVIVKDVESYNPEMQPFIDKGKEILAEVEAEGRFATAEQLEVHATFFGADLFAFETEVPNKVDVEGYIEAAKEMLRNTIMHDVMARSVFSAGELVRATEPVPVVEDPCKSQRCGTNNAFTCKLKTLCKIVALGKCSSTSCTCCRLW